MTRIFVTDRDGRQHIVDAIDGLPLMETLRDLEYGVAAICGGQACCGTCHVFVDVERVSELPPAAGDEQDLLDDLEYRQGSSRLSCQLLVSPLLEDLGIELAPEE